MNLVPVFKQQFPDHKIIFYNLEHKQSFDEHGAKNCNGYWEHIYGTGAHQADEIWDFNIENYPYHKFIGESEKFRFIPLRFTHWYEQFITDIPVRYNLVFEAKIDTKLRQEMLRVLCTETSELKRTSFKLVNCFDTPTRSLEKLDGRFGFDFPHWNWPETFNCFRIFEYLCLNIQPIVWDPFGTSKEYFGGLIIYLNYLSPQSIWEATRQEPRKDVAQKFKEMTYTPGAFEEYRKRIVMDFVTRTGTQVPDSVLVPVC